MKFDAIASSEIKSTHSLLTANFTRRRRISHCKAIFHPPARVDLVEKRPCRKTRSFFWWERTDSNHRSESQQIYSLPPLATRELSHIGAGGRTRTPDLLITNQLLYQLSYTSVSTLEYNNTSKSVRQVFFCTFLNFFLLSKFLLNYSFYLIYYYLIFIKSFFYFSC